MVWATLLLFLIAALCSVLLTPLVGRLAARLGIVDIPGSRKVHTAPVPRLGGVSVVISMGVAIAAARALGPSGLGEASLEHQPWVPLALGAGLVFLVGIWDDIRPIPASVKFLFQTVAAAIAIGYGIRFDRVSFLGETGIEVGFLALPLTFLWIIGITNAFNLIDGLDGLAAGLASIAAGTCAAVFLMRGNESEALLLLIVLGALVGFLRYNFYPARIFLGDSGSMVIGYILSITAITGYQKSVTALAVLFPLLVFGLPIADTLLSMLRRYAGGLRQIGSDRGKVAGGLASLKHIFRPDQEHIHHRLLEVGFSHRRAVLLLYGLALGLSTLALLTVMANGRNAGLVLILVGLASYVGISKLGYRQIRVLEAESLLRWYERMGLHSRFFLGFLDLLLISAAFWTAVVLKYEPVLGAAALSWFQWIFPLALVTQYAVFYAFGLYNGLWRALSTGDLLRIVGAAATGTVLSSIFALVSVPPRGVIGFFTIDFLVLVGLAIVCRSAYRILDYFRFGQVQGGRKAIIYGAGRAGQLALREMTQNSGLGLRPIGFVDDDAALAGCTVNRVPVLGGGGELESILDRHPDSVLVLAIANPEEGRLAHALSIAQERAVPVFKSELQLSPVSTEAAALVDEPASHGVLSEQPGSGQGKPSGVGSVRFTRAGS